MKFSRNLFSLLSRKNFYFPLMIVFTASTVTLVISTLMENQDKRQIENIIQTKVDTIKSEIIVQLDYRILALERMAKRWENRGGTPKREWEKDAQAHIKHQKVYQAIQWMDSSYYVRWIVPQKGNEAAIDLNLGLETKRREALESAKNSQEVTITPTVDLVQGGKGFIVYFPLFLEQKFDGFILGVFRVQTLLDFIFQKQTKQEYEFLISEGDQVIYNTISDEWSSLGQWSQLTTVELYGVKWQIQVFPSPELLASVQSPLPKVVRIVGLIIAFVLAWSVYLAQTTHQYAHQLEKTEKTLQKALKQAENANKAKMTFISNMNHELRTPLSIILSFTQILQMDSSLNATQQDSIDVIYQSGTHLLDLINDILYISKSEAGKVELNLTNFNLFSLLQEVNDLISLRIQQKGILFDYQIQSSLPSIIRCDKIRLKQVLINILGNAVKFTDTGRIIFNVGYVEERRDDEDGEENFQSSSLRGESSYIEENSWPSHHRRQSNIKHNKIRFQIEDTGVGIQKDKLAVIFLPFQQASTEQFSQSGTGLGLAISQNIVKQMGGEIRVISEPGKGSIFYFDLDLPEESDQSTA